MKGVDTAEPDFPLTVEGLAANKAFLKERREAGDPAYQYKGNATKAYVERIADLYLDREWEWVRSHDLPRETEFPVSDRSIENEVKRLVQEDRSWKTRSPLIKKYHPSVVEASRKNLDSPAAGWRALQSDRDRFRKFYLNRLRCSDWFNEFKKGKEEYTAHWPALLEGRVPSFIYRIGLTTSGKYMNVSMFKPHAAKYLIKKYLSGFDEVFDPFSGFSGRLLGAVACGKRYIGRDISGTVIGESKAMMEEIGPLFEKYGVKPEYDLAVADATAESGSYGCLLTCSPYADAETWKDVDLQVRTCDDWIDVCLERYDCGKYVFVTDGNIVKYRRNAVEVFRNQCHWGANEEFVVVIDKA